MKDVAAEDEGQAEGQRRQFVCLLPKGVFHVEKGRSRA